MDPGPGSSALLSGHFRVVPRKYQPGNLWIFDGCVFGLVYGKIPNGKGSDPGSHRIESGGDMHGMDLNQWEKLFKTLKNGYFLDK